MEKALHYVEIPKEIPEDAAHIRSYLESDVKALDKDSVIRDLNKVYFENRGFLTDYHLMQNELFTEEEQTEFSCKTTGHFGQISRRKDIICQSSFAS